MASNPRQNQIAELVAERGECSVAALARELGVSGMTIRRDLQALAETGRIMRTHGGAAPAQRVSFEFQFLDRVREHQGAKRAIAAAAAARVADGESVLLDSGTTTLAVAEALRSRKGLTIVTTSLPIASALQFNENLQVLLLGGLLRHGSPDLIGPVTEANLEYLRPDVAFLGADAIDLDGNVYNNSLAVGRMLIRMAAAARRVFVVADSGKVGRTALIRFGRLSQWEGLITDDALDLGAAEALERAGVRVTRASAEREIPV